MASYQDLVDRFVYGEGLLSTPPADFDPSQGGTVSGGDRQRAFAGTLANMAQNISTANEKGVGTGGLLAAAASGMTEGREFYKNTVEERARQRQQYTQSQQDRDAWRAIFNGDADPANLPAGVSPQDAAAIGVAGPQSGVSSALLAGSAPTDNWVDLGPSEDGSRMMQRNMVDGQMRSVLMQAGGGTTVDVNLNENTAMQLSDNAYKAIQKAQESTDAQYNILQSYQMMEDIALGGEEQGWTPNMFNRFTAGAQRLLEGFNIDANFGAGTTEPLTAMTNKLALYFRNPASGGGLTGNTSNRDVIFLKESIPSSTMSREGFWTLLKMSQAQAKFAAEYQEAKQDELLTNNGVLKKAFRDEWRNKKFLTDELREEIKQLAGMTQESVGGSGAPIPAFEPNMGDAIIPYVEPQ